MHPRESEGHVSKGRRPFGAHRTERERERKQVQLEELDARIHSASDFCKSKLKG